MVHFCTLESNINSSMLLRSGMMMPCIYPLIASICFFYVDAYIDCTPPKKAPTLSAVTVNALRAATAPPPVALLTKPNLDQVATCLDGYNLRPDGKCVKTIVEPPVIGAGTVTIPYHISCTGGYTLENNACARKVESPPTYYCPEGWTDDGNSCVLVSPGLTVPTCRKGELQNGNCVYTERVPHDITPACPDGTEVEDDGICWRIIETFDCTPGAHPVVGRAIGTEALVRQQGHGSPIIKIKRGSVESVAVTEQELCVRKLGGRQLASSYGFGAAPPYAAQQPIPRGVGPELGGGYRPGPPILREVPQGMRFAEAAEYIRTTNPTLEGHPVLKQWQSRLGEIFGSPNGVGAPTRDSIPGHVIGVDDRRPVGPPPAVRGVAPEDDCAQTMVAVSAPHATKVGVYTQQCAKKEAVEAIAIVSCPDGFMDAGPDCMKQTIYPVANLCLSTGSTSGECPPTTKRAPKYAQCDNGTKPVKGRCVETEIIPATASCPEGFDDSGTGCVASVTAGVPVCREGLKMMGDVCVGMSVVPSIALKLHTGPNACADLPSY